MLTTSLCTTSLNFFKSTAEGANLSVSNLSTLLFKLFKAVGTFSNLLISNLSISDFKLAKSVFLVNSDVSTPATLDFVAYWINLTKLLLCFYYEYMVQ